METETQNASLRPRKNLLANATALITQIEESDLLLDSTVRRRHIHNLKVVCSFYEKRSGDKESTTELKKHIVFGERLLEKASSKENT